uniref:Uncharacterized protein n=1 Tax=Chenopodium quinoa TaxID=63459 RepID=A0A803M1P3_CHEQI
MEGVGARLGRSSSRYGTTTVFNGPVRKWKKDLTEYTGVYVMECLRSGKITIAVLEEQKKEAEENSDDDEAAKPAESDENVGEQEAKSDGNAEKPDINDVPMEENQDEEENQTAPGRQDLNELDLSLGLTSHDEEHDSDSKTDPKADGQLERANSGA